jgi:hypothetical protein
MISACKNADEHCPNLNSSEKTAGFLVFLNIYNWSESGYGRSPVQGNDHPLYRNGNAGIL